MYHIKDRRFGCKRCRYKFGELTGTYLVEFYFSLDILAHLLYLYALGVPAYGIRFYVRLNLTTIEKTFRIFTQSIYNESLLVDIGKKNVDGDPKVKSLVFGIYERNGKVITVPVPDRKRDTLIRLIIQHTKKCSLYYTDDSTAYAALNLIDKILATSIQSYT